ncbi:MAG TPA: hypothetical protein VGB43_04565 [Flavobacterium sp.]|jgi:NAD/NADP transhydrogenase beta subunit
MTPKAKPGKKKDNNKIIVCVVGLAIGYYMLNHVATWEKPLLGNTFHIVMGCAIIAVCAIALAIILKERFYPKRKRKTRRQHVFLDDILKKEQEQKNKPNT